MKKIISFFLFSSLSLSAAYAAQDHNSSRSNKTASVAADLSDQSNDFSKNIQRADSEDYIRSAREMMLEVSAMEVRTDYIRKRLTIGIFVNNLLRESQALGCKSFEDKACIDKAIQKAEAVTIQKTRHDTAKNAIGNIR